MRKEAQAKLAAEGDALANPWAVYQDDQVSDDRLLKPPHGHADPETSFFTTCRTVPQGNSYYYNSVTGASQWEVPEGVVQQYLDQDNNPYYYNILTGESSWEPPGWWSNNTDWGNDALGQANEAPDAGAVIEAQDSWVEYSDSEGNPYYFNTM